MIILGVGDGPDASAALVVDNELVAAVEQERIDRTRHSRAFPSGAIDAVLDRAGVRARDVDRVAFGSAFTPSLLLRARPDLVDHVPRRLREAYRGYQSAMRRTGLYTIEQDASQKLLAIKMRGLGFERADVVLVDHDRAHANAAYRTQERPEALVITLDTPGDGAAVSVSVARHLQLDRLFLQTALSSVATFPRRLASLLRLAEPHLWALAAEAHPPAGLLDAFRREIRREGQGFNAVRPLPAVDPLAATLAAYSPAEVAAAADAALGEAVAGFVSDWVHRTGVPHLAVAGALFANPRLCGRVAALADVLSLWVCPAAGDEGLSVGAALAVAGTPVRRTTTLALGPRGSDDDCYKALSNSNLPRRKVADPDVEAARLLAEGKVVCRFSGGLEFGPRALGNRAVLFSVADAGDRARAQAAMGRDPALPAACATLDEDAHTSFDGLPRVAEAARFATVALRARPAFAAAYPGALHVDGTALPQRVGPDDTLRGVLVAYRERTARHTLGQASLNLAGEPVAATPLDAVRAWRASRADAMLLGPYLVEASDRG